MRGTWVVLEACRRHGAERVLVASSDNAYGPSDDCPTARTIPWGRYPYDASKAAADVIARCYWHSYGLPVAVTRFANLYGGGDLNASRLVPETVSAALDGRAPVIRSDGTPERDFLYVEDAVAGYLAIAEALGRGEGRGEAFNAGVGRSWPVREVVRIDLLDRGHRRRARHPRHRYARSGEIDRQWVDPARLEALTGWRPASISRPVCARPSSGTARTPRRASPRRERDPRDRGRRPLARPPAAPALAARGARRSDARRASASRCSSRTTRRARRPRRSCAPTRSRPAGRCATSAPAGHRARRPSATPPGAPRARRWSPSPTTTAARPPTGWSARSPPRARTPARSCRARRGRTPRRPSSLPRARRAQRRRSTRPAPWAQTCNIVYPRALLEAPGGFDESLPAAAGEDADLAQRAAGGGRGLCRGARGPDLPRRGARLARGPRARAWRWRHLPAASRATPPAPAAARAASSGSPSRDARLALAGGRPAVAAAAAARRPRRLLPPPLGGASRSTAHGRLARERGARARGAARARRRRTGAELGRAGRPAASAHRTSGPLDDL